MEPSLLERYRSDRRKLLNFLLSSGLIKQVRTPSGCSTSTPYLDLDALSSDYVLDCIKSGGVLDIFEASRKYHEESFYPVMIHSQSRNSYFLLSDCNSSGPPPQRAPPPRYWTSNHTSCSSSQQNPLINENTGDEYVTKGARRPVKHLKPVETAILSSFGLPFLNSGLSDDDLRESAYEILIASMAFAGVEVYFLEDRKKEKGSRILSRLKSKKDKGYSQSQLGERHEQLIDTIRIQMQISKAMDTCIRKSSMQFFTRTYEQIDIHQVLLGVLNGVLKYDFLNENSYMRWKRRQATVLEELLCSSADLSTTDLLTLKNLLSKIKHGKEWESMSHYDRSEAILSIGKIASKMSSRVGAQGGNIFQTEGYHVKLRLYERLLFAVFDILEEGKLIAEAEEILLLIKLTWSTLGITQKMHNALYGWVLFQQFLGTDDPTLLEFAILQVQKALAVQMNDEKEDNYISSLLCSCICGDKESHLGLLEAIFFSISIWCDSKLQDYHLHFSQNPSSFKKVVTLALAVETPSIEGCSLEVSNCNYLNKFAKQKLKTYVKGSVKAAYKRVAYTIDVKPMTERTNPLVLLANELKLMVEKELAVFCPVLHDWFPAAGIISASMLHQLYGERLKPFLKGVSCLSEDVRSVLSAADMLETYLTQLYTSSCKENRLIQPFIPDIDLYQIGEISRPIILDWVIAQHEHILDWTGRAFELEDWEPLSLQQKQAASVVEVFRIINETVDQFFRLDLPMHITHLQALLSVIFHSLDTYLLKVVNLLGSAVDKHHLFPSIPPLTRYEETAIPIIKKKLVENPVLDEFTQNKLKDLSISKLCVILNTLQYIQKQLDLLEDGIGKSWSLVKRHPSWTEEEPPRTLETAQALWDESAELFVATFNSIRDCTGDAIRKFSDFTGLRVVFWDLRDSFLLCLYRGGVEGARLDSVLPHVDSVLNHVCGLVDDALRDIVVLSVCRGFLEGYIWVLLNGGPSRAFSESDVVSMEDDLNMFQDFFVADGEGLPRSLVHQEAKLAQQILSLFSLQTETIIRMLMFAGENISTTSESRTHRPDCLEDSHTLIRILCHKKDSEASKFLKRHYQLPSSSEYEDATTQESILGSPFISDLLKRSAKFHWTEKGHSSFRLIKKKFQKATHGIRE